MICLMEFVGGFKLKDIFTANNNWAYFLEKTKTPIRPAILANVMKIINCGSKAMGFHVYECKDCQYTKKVFHTCKSRFCSSCGKKATDAWVSKHLTILPQTTYQHITFTLPKELQSLFWLNRHIINDIMRMPAQIITKLAKCFGVIPGIFVAIHTFGRDLKPNMHFHLSTTLSGLSLNKKQWMCYFRFNRPSLKKIKKLWRDGIIDLLLAEYSAGRLILPTDMPGDHFLQWLKEQRKEKWVVHFAPQCNNHFRNVEYLGRYLKRPPIGETRIKHFDGEMVTYAFRDHHDKTIKEQTMTAIDFIMRLIRHIPDKYFRVVRYYNWLANRTRGKWLPFIYEKLKQAPKINKVLKWRQLIKKTFGIDPLICPDCHNATLDLVAVIYPDKIRQFLKR